MHKRTAHGDDSVDSETALMLQQADDGEEGMFI